VVKYMVEGSLDVNNVLENVFPQHG
jgi:hypothetical protein